MLMVHAWVYKHRASIGKVRGSEPVPDRIDYDLWCGPAPKGPLPRGTFTTTGTGSGTPATARSATRVHTIWMPAAGRWAEPGLPASVFSIGGRFGYDDDGETPNTQLVLYEYASAPILFEVRPFPRTAKAT